MNTKIAALLMLATFGTQPQALGWSFKSRSKKTTPAPIAVSFDSTKAIALQTQAPLSEADFTQKAQEIQRELSATQLELVSTDRDRNRAEKEAQLAKTELNRLQNSHVASQESLKQQEATLNHYQSLAQYLTEQSNEGFVKAQLLERQLAEVQQHHEQQLFDVTNKHSEYFANISDELFKERSRRARADQEVDSLSKELESTQLLLSSAQSEKDSLSSQTQELQSLIASLKDENKLTVERSLQRDTRYQNLFKDLNCELKRHQETLAEKNQRLAKVESNLEKSINQSNALFSTVNHVKSLHDNALRSHHMQTALAVKNLKQDTTDLQKSLDISKTQLKAQGDSYENLYVELERARRELNAHKAATRTIDRDQLHTAQSKNAADQERTKLLTTIALLTDQLQTLSSSHRDHATRARDVSQKLTQLAERLETSEKKCLVARREKQRNDARINSLQNELSQSNQTVAALKNAHDQAQVQVEKHAQMLAQLGQDFQAAQLELQDANKKLLLSKSFEKKLVAANKHTVNQEEYLSQVIDHYESQINKYHQDLEIAGTHPDYAAQISEYEKKLAAKEHELTNLNNKLIAMQSKKAPNGTLNMQLSATEQEVVALKLQLANLTSAKENNSETEQLFADYEAKLAEQEKTLASLQEQATSNISAEDSKKLISKFEQKLALRDKALKSMGEKLVMFSNSLGQRSADGSVSKEGFLAHILDREFEPVSIKQLTQSAKPIPPAARALLQSNELLTTMIAGLEKNGIIPQGNVNLNSLEQLSAFHSQVQRCGTVCKALVARKLIDPSADQNKDLCNLFTRYTQAMYKGLNIGVRNRKQSTSQVHLAGLTAVRALLSDKDSLKPHGFNTAPSLLTSLDKTISKLELAAGNITPEETYKKTALTGLKDLFEQTNEHFKANKPEISNQV